MKEKETLGTTIANLRKGKNLTQAELAAKLNITDKAVSKWERDLSCPDVNCLPQLAEELGVTVDELMRARLPEKSEAREKVENVVGTVLKAIPVAMGVGVTVLSILGELDSGTAFTLLGIGLACAGVSMLSEEDK